MNLNRVDISPSQDGITTISNPQNRKVIQVSRYGDETTDVGNFHSEYNNHVGTKHRPDGIGDENGYSKEKRVSTPNWIKEKGNSNQEGEEYVKINKTSMDKMIHMLLVIIVAIVSFSVFAFIPFHNIIKFPEYWYEPIFIWTFGYWPIYIYFSVVHCKYIIEYPDDIVWSKVFLYVFLPILANAVVEYVITYFAWGVYLGFYLPMPFMGVFQVWVSNILLPIGVWFQVPSNVRSSPVYRERLKSFFWYFLIEQSIPYQMIPIQLTIPIVAIWNPDFIFIYAFVLLLKSELNIYVMERFISKATNDSNDQNGKAIMSVQIKAIYTITIVVLISTATQIASFVFLGVDFAMNLFLTFRIIRLHKKVDASNLEFQETQKQIEEMVTSLIVAEAVEFLVPLTYIITFTMVYFGPNAKISGNVQNDYWQFVKVDNLLTYFTGALQMTIIDLVSFILSSVLLWKLCNINTLKESKKIIKRYGVLSVIFIAELMDKVRCIFTFCIEYAFYIN